jgi:hypothetical protein
MNLKLNSKSLATLGLVVIFLYCGVRTLMTLSNAQKSVVTEASNSGISLEPLLHNLEQGFFAEADTIDAEEVTRDPLSIVKRSYKKSSWSKPPTSSAKSPTRVTGLVLDENPVAIMEIGGVSKEVKIGDRVDGNKVIHIDEQGVHVLKDGKSSIIR